MISIVNSLLPLRSFVEPCCQEKVLELESTYTLDEFEKVAKKDSLILFTYQIKDIYGEEFPL